MYLRFFLPIVFAVLVLGVASSLPEAEAHIETCIEDENSEVCIITESEDDGLTDNWTIFDNEEDEVGIDHLDGQELFICELVEVQESDGVECANAPENLSFFDFIEDVTEGSTSTLLFQDEDFVDLTIEITWEIIGGLFGSSESTLKETIEVTEGSTTYRIFQETDFDLAGGNQDTFVQISSTFARQEDSTPEFGPPIVGTVIVDPPADKVMAGIFDEVVEAITGNGELDGTTGPIIGEKNYVFGFSWDSFDLSEGGTFTIEKTKQLGPFNPSGNGGGGPWEDPSLGPDSGGIVIHDKGICINITCWDVTQNYHVDFELYEMLTGTNTISLTIWCPHGVTTCDRVELGITPPNESKYSSIWSIAIKKDISGEWKLKKDDSEGRLGDITFTVQEVGTQFLSVSFSIDFKNLSTDKMWLWVELGDTNDGVNLFFFNEGVEFKDSDAYPSIETEYEDTLEIDPLCLNEDPTYRYSCGFAKILEGAIQIAEETLRQIMNNEYLYK